MTNYVILIRLTDQGIRAVKDTTQILKGARKDLEQRGGKLKDFFLTMGDIDYVAIVEAPGDEVCLGFVLGLASTGFVRTTTLKAFTEAQVETIAI